MKTLVTGANGNLGKEIVRQLVQKTAVQAGVRNLETAIKNEKATYVVFDYDKPETYTAAVENVNQVLLIVPPLDASALKRLTPFIDFLKENGIKRVALLSALGVNHDETAPLRTVELKLINDGFDYTIIRPNFFMENYSTGIAAESVKNDGVIVASAGEGKTSFVSTLDIAAVFTTVLTEKGHSNKEYDLTGSEALTHSEIATILSNALDKPVNYISVSHEELKAGAMEHQMPESAADYLVNLYKAVEGGFLESTTSDIQEVTGKAPITFKEFAAAIN